MRFFLGPLMAVLLLSAKLCADEYVLTIRSENPDCPMLVEIPLPEGADADRTWEIDRQQIPIQPSIGDRRKLWALLRPDQLNQKLILRSVPSDRLDPLPPATRSLEATERDGQLALMESGEPILNYHTGTSQPPAGLGAHYARSGHIHPLMTPTGQVVTSEFPFDHPHQHGLFFAWVNTQFSGHKVDFWNQQSKLGTVRHKRLVSSVAGRVFCGFESELEHLDLTQGETVVLNETWRVMALNLSGPANSYHLIDFESRIVASTETPLEVQKYHYGGFGWRGPEAWLLPQEGVSAKGCTFLTSLGDDRLQGNHTRPDWVAVTGRVDDIPSTVAILGCPANFRHPQPVRLHPDKPYFCFAPCVLGEFTIGREQPLVSRYRIVTHTGTAIPALYDGLARQWKQPEVVEYSERTP